jgi:hypothetical protein
MFKVDHQQAGQERYLPPEGDYEVAIGAVKRAVTGKGTEYIDITLRIRDDVKQEGAGKRFDYPLYRLREPTPVDPDGYPNSKVQRLSLACGISNGTSFDSIDEWMKALEDKNLRVTVRHEIYNDRPVARVAYLYASKVPGGNGFVQVDDNEDLPF